MSILKFKLRSKIKKDKYNLNHREFLWSNYMSTKEEKAFFERSVLKYSRLDVCTLLEAKLDCAGPLLEVIVNGIDCLGGILYGFEPRNSKHRSVRFMKEKMSIPESLAKFFYSAVRCGIAHQGMPKIGLIYFVEYEYPEQERIFSKDGEGNIWINVVGLAQCFLNTIDTLSADIETCILNIPEIPCKEKRILKQALNEITNDIDDIAFDIGNEKMHQRYPTASYSAYSTKGTLRVCKDSPKQFVD